LPFHCLFCCFSCSWYLHPWLGCVGGRTWNI
jgi:hypothetical protein